MNVEHRTSNIEWKTNIKYRKFNTYFCFFSAVLILVTKILINSSVSFRTSFSSSGFLISGTRWISFNHLWVSLSSFNEIRSLWIKSVGDSAAWASHGLDKVKYPISTFGPQHGCLLWYLVAVQRSLWFAPNTQAAFLPDHMSVSSSFPI